jgi:hypothetical protein
MREALRDILPTSFACLVLLDGHRTQRPRGQVGPPGPHPAQPSSSLDPGGERRPISPPLAPLIAQLVECRVVCRCCGLTRIGQVGAAHCSHTRAAGYSRIHGDVQTRAPARKLLRALPGKPGSRGPECGFAQGWQQGGQPWQAPSRSPCLSASSLGLILRATGR